MDNPRLENWSIELVRAVAGSPLYYRLNGNVYNHPYQHLLEGEYIYTSPLRSIDFRFSKAETDSRIYDLGKKLNGTIIPFAGPKQ